MTVEDAPSTVMLMVAQPALFEGIELNQVINVAQVPKYSPFRYPGGKTWLVPRVRKWLKSLPALPSEFYEPFAGGGITSLTVAFENLATHVIMVELDAEVAAVWEVIINGDAKWLADKIIHFKLTPQSLERTLSKNTTSINELAFKTILKNRTFHGGILANGSAPLKHGENGKGIHSRWYAETLNKRILNIGSIRHRITFIKGDGMELLAQYQNDKNAVWFIDPPYTVKGKGKRAGRRLYNHSELDHENLFDMVSKVSGGFLMTYDNDDDVKDLAKKHNFDFEPIAMKGTHHAQMNELLISNDLDWART